MKIEIKYKINYPLNVEETIDLYKRSTLAERRPVDRPDVFAKMLFHSNLIVTAYDGNKLIGIARSFTDFGYVAYLADLAVDKEYQRSGIGKNLIQLTQDQLDEKCMIVLLAAPLANDYYPKVGFEHNPRAWIKKK